MVATLDKPTLNGWPPVAAQSTRGHKKWPANLRRDQDCEGDELVEQFLTILSPKSNDPDHALSL